MNGEQQKERRGEIVRLDQYIEKLEQSALDMFNTEVEARQQAVEELKRGMEELKSLVAKMIDSETMFRQRSILIWKDALSEVDRDLANALLTFITLPWWKRYLWMIFGGQTMKWFPTTFDQGRLDPIPATNPDIKAGYKGHKP